MARNETPDREMEERLREHFAEEARDLQAPEDLWTRLEGRLGKQEPPRFALLRGGVTAIGGRPWIPAAAAAVVVVAVGMGAWVLAGGPGDSGGGDANDAPAAAAASDRGRVEPAATEAAATEAAYAEATQAAAAEEAYAEPTQAAATERSARAEATQAATEAPARAEATQAAATEAPARAEATQAAATEATQAATQAAATEAAATEAPAAAVTATAVAEAPTPEPAPVPESASPGDSDVADDGSAADAPAAEEPGEPSDDMADADMSDDMDADDMSDDMDAGMGGDAAEGDMAEDGPDEPAPKSPQPAGGPTEPRVTEPEQPSDTTFEDYGRTPFVDASTDAVSTFSLDTDRTSYFLALTWARGGFTVDPDSVRAEEWVNSFDYGYAGPGDDDSFAITSDVVEHPLNRDWHLARVALQAPDLRDDVPLNVTLVLDASGSMSTGNRVAIAREAAEAIRQSLGSRDRIAVIHFTDDVIDSYTVEHSSPDDEDVIRSINRLAPHFSTNVQAGLNLGVMLADEARRERPEAYNYIILLSDGVANVDATDPFVILESAADTDSSNPLRLITIGVGIENYNDVLLEQLAQHGNGWYRYLDNSDQARETFSREHWLALSTPFADQARAQVTWDPAVVKAWRIVGYENRITPDHTFTQNRREFAELPSGTATTVLYELELQEGVSASTALGSVEVRWVDPSSGASLSQSTQVTGRTDARFQSADRYLRLGAIVGLAADRYSALSPQVENAVVNYDGIHSNLSALLREFDALQGQLGTTQAYLDFRFLLDQLTLAAAELAPSSGYSP